MAFAPFTIAPGELPDLLLNESSLMYRLLQPKPVQRLLEAHQSGREDNHKLLFSLVMVEQCLRAMSSEHEQSARKAVVSDQVAPP